MKHPRTLRAVFLGLAAIVMLAVMTPLTGCQNPFEAAPLTSQTKQTISEVKQQAAIDQANATTRAAAIVSAGAIAQAKQNAKAALNKLQGEQSPTAHPVSALNNFIVELRKPLELFTAIMLILWILAFAYSCSTLPLAALVAEAVRPLRVASLSFLAATITLPFLPYGLLFLAVALCAIFGYEVYKAKGNVETALTDTEELLGVKAEPTQPSTASTVQVTQSTPATVATAPPTPAAANTPIIVKPA